MKRLFVGLFSLLLFATSAGAGDYYGRPKLHYHHEFWNGALPACDQPDVLGRIAEKFAYADVHILYTGLAIKGFHGVRESAMRAGGPSLIDRRYCKATAIMSNGRRYAVVYLIESGQGFASIGWNVESCLPAFDPWRVYDAWCRSIYP